MGGGTRRRRRASRPNNDPSHILRRKRYMRRIFLSFIKDEMKEFYTNMTSTTDPLMLSIYKERIIRKFRIARLQDGSFAAMNSYCLCLINRFVLS